MARQPRIVEVEMPDGGVFNVEVATAGSVSDVAAGGRLRLESARDSLDSLVRWVVSNIGLSAGGNAARGQHIDNPLGMEISGVGVEFGIKLAVKSGALASVLAEASGEATAVIRVEWSRSPGEGVR